MYAGFAVLYGICETVNGNWSQLDMTSKLGAATTQAAIALTAFWAMVTAGRVVFAGIDRWMAVSTTYHLLPLLLAATFVVIAILPDGATGAGIVAFAIAGAVIASYQLGYGIAAFGVGPLLDHGVKLSTVYGFGAVVAVAMGLASFGVTRAVRREHVLGDAATLPAIDMPRVHA
jgi:hypothetical protein